MPYQNDKIHTHQSLIISLSENPLDKVQQDFKIKNQQQQQQNPTLNKVEYKGMSSI